MKKVDIGGGTKTTDGNEITYSNVKNSHIGRTYTFGDPNPQHTTSSSNHSTWKQPPSSNTKTVTTGVTFKKADHLSLNSKDISKMHSSKEHKIYENSKDYPSSQSTSFKK